jgi:hypothetical protein
MSPEPRYRLTFRALRHDVPAGVRSARRTRRKEAACIPPSRQTDAKPIPRKDPINSPGRRRRLHRMHRNGIRLRHRNSRRKNSDTRPLCRRSVRLHNMPHRS